ncbi:RNA polymerase II-associated protein 3 [Biomphalaria glabrata]|nr:RNA polymerase II-associated protein 3-like; partial [Biomphalaria glabrata]
MEGMEHVADKPDAETELPDLRLVEEQHRRAESLAEKEKGNEFYKSGQLDRAIEAYSKGLKFQPNDPLLLSNRAQAYLKLQKYTECDADCSLSLKYDPFYVKSYLRRSSARSALGRHAEALDDLKQALDIEPTNQEAKKALERLQDLLSKKDVGHDQKSDEYKKVPGHMTQETLDLKQQYSVYGKHECLMLEGTEGDLHLHYKNCTKNPGHTQFIPIRAFTLQHLPDEFRDEDLFQLIKATADLTVRISVNMVSPNRPEFRPKSTDPYPFYNKGGDTTPRAGTGELNLFKYVDGIGYDLQGQSQGGLGDAYEAPYKTCRCENCLKSGAPSRSWWEMIVSTAAHVVYDQLEAEHTSCRLFFDERKSPEVLLTSLTMDTVIVESDWSELKYVTCDKIGNQLFARLQEWDSLWKKVDAKYMNRPEVKLSFIISHPHGCPKQVTIGQWIDNVTINAFDENMDIIKLTYSTNTCPGSSGARVHCIGLRTIANIHNGSADADKNYSVGVYLKNDKIMS